MKDADISKKRLVYIFAFLSLVYFGLFVIPNSTGAVNEDMIAIFEIDEYAQYPHVIRMLEGGSDLKQTIRGFLVYLHYFYGYPFYFFSALILLPMRLIMGNEWAAQTPTIMLTLRQFINVLPNIITVWLLSYAATKFKSVYKSVGIFLLLLVLPGLSNNSLWWHTDGLALLCMALIFFFLRIDNLRFGRHFWYCAILAGVGISLKYIGAFFIFVIPLYLVYGIHSKAISWKKSLFSAALFLVIMFVSLLVSNPLLLLPLERSEIISTQLRQFEYNSEGILIGRAPLLQGGMLPSWLVQNYGSLPFLLLVFVAILYGLIKQETRGKAFLLVGWLLPNFIVLVTAAHGRSHYWLPVFLPAICALVFLFPDDWKQLSAYKAARIISTLAILLIVVQAGFFLNTTLNKFLTTTHRVNTSSSLQFYYAVKPQIAEWQDKERIVVYRDWKVYFPESDLFDVFTDWDLASYALIDSRDPDIVILERENVLTYGDEFYLENSPDNDRILAMHDFYRDALMEDLSGYSLFYEDAFGLVFERQ